MRHTSGTTKKTAVTLKAVADHLGLSAGTVSLVLNHAPQSIAIPQKTQSRIFAAARELNYQPNLVARALRTSSPPPSAHGTNDAPGALMFVGAEYFQRAMHAMRKAGLRVPGDVSVVGFNSGAAPMDRLTP